MAWHKRRLCAYSLIYSDVTMSAMAFQITGPDCLLLALCTGNSPVTGEFPAQKPVTRNFDGIFDLRLE